MVRIVMPCPVCLQDVEIGEAKIKVEEDDGMIMFNSPCCDASMITLHYKEEEE